MAATGSRLSVPYLRLAILYRKAKRPADEERIVRLALAHLGPIMNDWFIVRLAKILSEQRLR